MYNWRWFNDEFPELANVEGALKFIIVERARRRLRATPMEMPNWLHGLLRILGGVVVIFLIYYSFDPPLWLAVALPFLVLGVPALMWLKRFYLNLDRSLAEELVIAGVRPALCVCCRYDLKGCPADAKACPECGSVIAPIHDPVTRQVMADQYVVDPYERIPEAQVAGEGHPALAHLSHSLCASLMNEADQAAQRTETYRTLYWMVPLSLCTAILAGVLLNLVIEEVFPGVDISDALIVVIVLIWLGFFALILRVYKQRVARDLNDVVLRRGVRPLSCLRCEYDLRGCPAHAEQCPECGNPIATIDDGDGEVDEAPVTNAE